MLDEHSYYSTHSPLTDPGSQSVVFSDSPTDLNGLASWIRNVQFHEAYALEAKLDLPSEAVDPLRDSDAAVRFVEEMLRRIIARDDRPLGCERSKENCFIGTCRDYAVLLCALLRAQGRPARVRCGFAFYFDPQSGFGDDHWVTEVWDRPTERWVLVDAEVDSTLPQHSRVSIDPLDVPREKFQVAGTAWRKARAGLIDPSKFGVQCIGISGEWFMAASVIRDLAALNKIEMLPFDYWGVMGEIAEANEVSAQNAALIDMIAEATSDEGFDFDGLRKLYRDQPGVRVRDPIMSWPKGVGCEFELRLE